MKYLRVSMVLFVFAKVYGFCPDNRDWASARKVTFNYVYKVNQYQTTASYNLSHIVRVILGMYRLVFTWSHGPFMRQISQY